MDPPPPGRAGPLHSRASCLEALQAEDPLGSCFVFGNRASCLGIRRTGRRPLVPCSGFRVRVLRIKNRAPEPYPISHTDYDNPVPFSCIFALSAFRSFTLNDRNGIRAQASLDTMQAPRAFGRARSANSGHSAGLIRRGAPRHTASFRSEAVRPRRAGVYRRPSAQTRDGHPGRCGIIPRPAIPHPPARTPRGSRPAPGVALGFTTRLYCTSTSASSVSPAAPA